MLTEYYHLLIRRKWVLIIALAVMMVLVLRYNSRLVPIYQATATLIIDKKVTRSPISGQSMSYETYMSESLSFNTHFELITSRPVLEQVVRDLHLDQVDPRRARQEFIEVNAFKQFWSRFKKNVGLLFSRQEVVPSNEDRGADFTQALKGMIRIENVEDTRLLKINVSSPAPEKAQDVANSLAQAYIDFNIQNRMKSSRDTLKWLTDRLYDMKKKLEDAEEAFLTYKQREKLISVEGRQNVIAQKITEFNDAYLQARNQRIELDTRLAQLEQILASGRDTPLLRSLVENELIKDLYGQLVASELELAGLSKVYKSKHAKLIQV
jgi:uncharacterized protein involved in exopolysaccharide biosynthesis